MDVLFDTEQQKHFLQQKKDQSLSCTCCLKTTYAANSKMAFLQQEREAVDAKSGKGSGVHAAPKFPPPARGQAEATVWIKLSWKNLQMQKRRKR